MSEVTNTSLQKIFKGSTISFAGTILGLFLALVGRIVFVRVTTQEEYGLYSLAFTVVAIFTTISTLGLNEGSSRYIAFFKGKGETENIKLIIFSSIIIALFASIITTIISFVASEIISLNLLNSSEASYILKILSITIPFVVLTNVVISIYRGFSDIYVNVYFNNIIKNVSFIFLLIVAIILELSFIGMVYFYTLSAIVTFFILILYFRRKPPLTIKWNNIGINQITKELFLYSVPLLTVNILLTVMTWTDTLMLGYFKTPDVVGYYNAIYPVANLLSVFINSMAFLYVPIITHLYSSGQTNEMKRIYTTSTKWCFILSFPLFFVMFSFPDLLLNLIYGSRYIVASSTLQILLVGFIFNSYFGFNYYTLLSIGKSKFLMNCSLISAILNIILNLILIPKIGMIGAAIASASSFLLIEIYMTITLYTHLKIHPFTKNYLKITIISALLISITYFSRTLFESTYLMSIIFLIIFLVLYFLLIVVTKSFDQNDEMILQILKKKCVLKNLSFLKMFK